MGRLERNKHPLHCLTRRFETIYFLSISLEAGIWVQFLGVMRRTLVIFYFFDMREAGRCSKHKHITHACMHALNTKRVFYDLVPSDTQRL
jgi:hypothetical protein